MVPAANWKGFLQLSSASCGIALDPSTATEERRHLDIVTRDPGNRIRYRRIDAETGADVPVENRVKSYKATGGRYALLASGAPACSRNARMKRASRRTVVM
jgi:DNA end-binding protein Ku